MTLASPGKPGWDLADGSQRGNKGPRLNLYFRCPGCKWHTFWGFPPGGMVMFSTGGRTGLNNAFFKKTGGHKKKVTRGVIKKETL